MFPHPTLPAAHFLLQNCCFHPYSWLSFACWLSLPILFHSNKSPEILLLSPSLFRAPNCYFFPAWYLLLYLCPRFLLPSLTLVFPRLRSAHPQLFPSFTNIVVLSFLLQTFQFLYHLLFSFVGLHCCQVLFPPAPWMPAEGAVIAQLKSINALSLLPASQEFWCTALVHQQRCESIKKSSYVISSQRIYSSSLSAS